MKKQRDFVVAIVSHPDNVTMRQKTIDSIKNNIPAHWSYDIVVETGGTNWNEGMYLAFQRITKEYALKYGFFNFDDDVCIEEGSFNNMEKYIGKYDHFQFRMRYNNGKERPVSTMLVKTPMLALSIRNIIKSDKYIFPYYFISGNKRIFDTPNQCVSCCFSYMFIGKNCFKYFEDGFIHDPYVFYGEDVLFGLYLLSRGIKSYTIPRFVNGYRGYTKDKRYNFYQTSSSVFYQYHYIFSHKDILQAMEENKMLDLDMSFLAFCKRMLAMKLP